jgi:hypothetical protein
MATSDLTDLAPIEVQFALWGYCLTDRTPARMACTRLNEAAITEHTPTVDLSERYWDRTARDLRRISVNDGPPPPSWALAGVRLALPGAYSGGHNEGGAS